MNQQQQQQQPEWALTKVEKEKRKYIESLTSIFMRRKDEFQAALKDTMDPEFFRRLVVTAATKTPKLMECTHASLYQAALEIAQLQLEPNTELGEAYLIPYRNGRTGRTECQVQIGRNGWVKLAKRTGLVKGAPNAIPVYRGEDFTWQPGATPEVLHRPSMDIDEDAEIIAAYAWVDFTDGSRAYEVLRLKDIKRIKKSAMHGNKMSPAWRDYEDRMVCRSALKRLIRTRLPVNEHLSGMDTLAPESRADGVTVDVSSHEDATPLAINPGHDLDTGEVFDVVSPGSDEPRQPDGADAASPDDARDPSTTLTLAQFWKSIKARGKFWGVSLNKNEVLALVPKGKNLDTMNKVERAEFAYSVEDRMSAISQQARGNKEGARDEAH